MGQSPMADRRRQGLVDGLTAVAVGTAMAGKAYHVVVRPEWTEPEALRGLWPLWALVLLLVLAAAGGMIWDD